MEWDGNQRDIVFHFSSIFLPPFPPPPLFLPTQSSFHYLFCIDTFLSLCVFLQQKIIIIIKKVFLWLWNSHFSLKKFSIFLFHIFLLLFSGKHLATNGKSISPSECVCVTVQKIIIICVEFVYEKENLFFSIKKNPYSMSFAFSLMSCLWHDSSHCRCCEDDFIFKFLNSWNNNKSYFLKESWRKLITNFVKFLGIED